jgi:uncharacterized membrane protein YhhN
MSTGLAKAIVTATNICLGLMGTYLVLTHGRDPFKYGFLITATTVAYMTYIHAVRGNSQGKLRFLAMPTLWVLMSLSAVAFSYYAPRDMQFDAAVTGFLAVLILPLASLVLMHWRAPQTG